MKMKKQLLETVKKLQEDGINIEKTPPLFKWSYPEEPDIEFNMLIKKKESNQLELPLSSTVH